MILNLTDGTTFELDDFFEMKDIRQMCMFLRTDLVSAAVAFSSPNNYFVISVKHDDDRIDNYVGYNSLVSIEPVGDTVRVCVGKQ